MLRHPWVNSRIEAVYVHISCAIIARLTQGKAYFPHKKR